MGVAPYSYNVTRNQVSFTISFVLLFLYIFVYHIMDYHFVQSATQVTYLLWSFWPCKQASMQAVSTRIKLASMYFVHFSECSMCCVCVDMIDTPNQSCAHESSFFAPCFHCISLYYSQLFHVRM